MSIVQILESVVENRNNFLSDQLMRRFPYNARYGLATQYFAGEYQILTLMNQMYSSFSQRRQETANITFNIPSSFLEPIPIRPNPAQVESSVISVSPPSPSVICSICQDTISNDACQIRQCGHHYHRRCLSDWLSVSVRCPICRHDIREESLEDQTSSDEGQMTPQSEGQ